MPSSALSQGVNTLADFITNTSGQCKWKGQVLDRGGPLRALRIHEATLASVQMRNETLATIAKLREPLDPVLAMQDRVAMAYEPLRSHESLVSNAVAEMVALSARQDEALRLALGPLRDFESLRLAELLQTLAADADRISSIAVRAAASFRYPELNETSRVIADMLAKNDEAFERLSSYQDSIQSAMDAIQAPWIKAENALQSVSAFTDLHAMAADLARFAPFDGRLVRQLRGGLGDWRDHLALPEGVGDSLRLRSDFYVDRGFDPELTEFPNAVFEQTLERGQLRQPIPPIDDPFIEEVPSPDDANNDGLVRTNWAHDRITRLELHVRVLIEREMKAVVGDNWIRQRVPGPMRDAWAAKRGKAIQAGEKPLDLIHYADFTDYRVLIERRDNWNEVFKPVFGRKEDIRESWQRLFPIRIATMHARLISQDDELLLVVETKRILKAIGVL